MEVDKERCGGAGKDRDSVRAAILEEAVIVCNFTLCLFIKKIKIKNKNEKLVSVALIGLCLLVTVFILRSSPHLVSVVQLCSVNGIEVLMLL